MISKIKKFLKKRISIYSSKKEVEYDGIVLYHNKVLYDTEKILFKELDKKIEEYKNFINNYKKSETHVKLEQLGLTSSKSYDYKLNVYDEEVIKKWNYYKEKYSNVIFVPETVFDELNFNKVYKKDFNYLIPDNILDLLIKFKIDSDDYKIFEYNEYYSNPTPSEFTYSEVEYMINKKWSVESYRKDYLNKFYKGEQTYVGSGKNSLKNKHTTNGRFKTDINFFFVITSPKNIKKSFKNFINENNDVNEFFIMQPVKGGYLLICNW